MALNECDIVIIGGGAAGLTAGMFAVRRGCSVLILTRDFGGQTASTAEIENYPGFGRIEGTALMALFEEQAARFGCDIRYESVRRIEKDGERFCVVTHVQSYYTHAVICAAGKAPKSLGVDGEENFLGNGIEYSSFREPQNLIGKSVAVVGGGNSAVQAVGAAAQYASRVYLIHRREEFRAEKIILDRLSGFQNIEKRLSATVTSVSGDSQLQSLTMQDANGAQTDLVVDALCIAVGFETQTNFLGDWVERSPDGALLVNERCETKTPGLYAAGDVTQLPYQQIVISAGEGAKAALAASAYVCALKGARALKVDWGFRSL